MSQNEHHFNKAKWNNYFVQGADAIGRQILTKQQLTELRNQVDGTARTYIREGSILAQDTLGVEPTEIRRARKSPQRRRPSVQFRVYENIPFPLSKSIKYLNLHRNRVMRQDGSYSQSLNENPAVQAVISTPPTSSELDRIYESQFRFPFEGDGTPLPNAVDQVEFRLRHDIKNLPKLMIDNMRRRGLDDESNMVISGGSRRIKPSRIVPRSDVTRFERSCLDRAL